MTRLLIDVNAFAVSLVESHPGHEYVTSHVHPALTGDNTLLVYSYLPFRAQWVLTTKWGYDRVDARNAVSSFLQHPMAVIDADIDTVLNSYDISSEKNHDVYDSFYISLARTHNTDAILTTDRGFEQLCEGESFEYLNPVPDDVLERFSRINS
ncbi:hypothetical protein HAPAU_32520 [Halalkalicoccus paucihalophilus]|uniref:PIN domain-containing protein n=1 Tax=Halalkalicoccus paucihalophilus TaxID=1008153 RepID=A0A151AB62_9EURY|nr:PIN domain-containing protein [Halalkalicoccus paucihalophilus]KYH24875.1 hypothetical protein HAPAU_32520 [Halalkalicoccus paucihalophilus]